MSNKALIVLLLLTAATLADDKRTNAISTLTSPSAELHRRLAAVDELTEMQATAELLRAWADGGEAVRIAVPVGFHAIGVRALGPGLTALGDEDERVRAAGAALLGALGRAGRLGVNRLLIALNDESALVRRQAALALGNIGAAAENAVSGLIALAIDRPAEASIAMQAMTRITLDVQLNVARKPLPERIRDSIRPAESWLLRMQKPDGSWGDLRTTALVLIALCEGGLADDLRKPVRKAFRYITLKLNDMPRVDVPRVVIAIHSALRETRDPLLRILADRVAATVQTSRPTDAGELAWWLLAQRHRQWSGVPVDLKLFAGNYRTDPALIGLLLSTEADEKRAAAAAERMVAEKLIWKPKERRWAPDMLVRGTWGIQLVGGDSASRFRRLLYQVTVQRQLRVDGATQRWEAPAGVRAEPVEMTAGVIAALKIASLQFPPYKLERPKAAKQRQALSALRGCLGHPDKALQAYAQSMLTLWK